MKLTAAVWPLTVSVLIASTTAFCLRVLCQAAGRRLYFSSGWLLVLLTIAILIHLRRRQLALDPATPGNSLPRLTTDAILTAAYIFLTALHIDMGTPEGAFEYLLFALLVFISALGVLIHLTLMGLCVAEDDIERGPWRKRLAVLLDLQIPLVLASLPVMLLHGVLSHAHGALSHLVKGGSS